MTDLGPIDEATAYKLGALTAQAIAAAVEADRKQRAQSETHSEVLTWDWKEDVPLEDIGRAIEEASDNRVHLHLVDTGSDQVAIVVTNELLTVDGAQKVYNDTWGNPDWDDD